MKPQAKQLHRLFAGLPRAHGKTVVTGKRDPRKGKMQGRSQTVLEPVTDELWERHLEGTYGLGIIPITDEATVNWGAIDVDQYDLDLAALEAKVHDLRLPLVTCRTKSGGAHLYLFLSEPVDAETVKQKLTDLAVALGYPGVEVFPKQVQLASDRDVGNWLNMPYFDARETQRYAVEDGHPVDVRRFIELAEAARVDAEHLDALNPPVNSEFQDGPPCLQQLSLHGFPEGTRNNSLFNLGVYARLKYPDDWQAKVEEYNHKFMDPPLGSGEVQAVLKSLGKKAYRYRCDEPPICNVCNRGLCLGRRYGVAGGGEDEPHDVQLGSLTKYLTEPPLYVLDVDGRRIELSTDELLDHGKFRKKCMEQLNKLPPRRKPATWDKVVQALVSDCEEVEAPIDASAGGRVWQLLEEWVTNYAAAVEKDELLAGKPWTEGQWTYFRSGDFQQFLDHQGFRDFRGRRLWAELRRHGAHHHQFNINGRCVQVWCVPAFGHGPDELTTRRARGEY